MTFRSEPVSAVLLRCGNIPSPALWAASWTMHRRKDAPARPQPPGGTPPATSHPLGGHTAWDMDGRDAHTMPPLRTWSIVPSRLRLRLRARGAREESGGTRFPCRRGFVPLALRPPRYSGLRRKGNASGNSSPRTSRRPGTHGERRASTSTKEIIADGQD
ncbi:hypothetical protein LCGC14_0511080 [marine sediment metagenome]|uniref:Uncharacterized protein n=2 Tax=marine sediment metagenome TaxID=412755 RepID=A0A0F9SJJ5_9ZZZZ